MFVYLTMMRVSDTPMKVAETGTISHIIIYIKRYTTESGSSAIKYSKSISLFLKLEMPLDDTATYSCRLIL